MVLDLLIIFCINKLAAAEDNQKIQLQFINRRDQEIDSRKTKWWQDTFNWLHLKNGRKKRDNNEV